MVPHAALCAWVARNWRTAPTFHALTLSDNFTGLGNWPALHLRQSVADENGTTSGISCDCRTYPDDGRLSKVDASVARVEEIRCDM